MLLKDKPQLFRGRHLTSGSRSDNVEGMFKVVLLPELLITDEVQVDRSASDVP